MTCSVYTTVTVALDRYFELSGILKNHPWVKNGKVQCLSVFIFSVLFNFTRWFEFEYVYVYDIQNSTTTNAKVGINVSTLTLKVELQGQSKLNESNVLLLVVYHHKNGTLKFKFLGWFEFWIAGKVWGKKHVFKLKMILTDSIF